MIRGVSVVLNVEEPKRRRTLEDEPLLGIARRDERHDVGEDVVAFDHPRIDAVLARDLRDPPLRGH